MAERQVGRRVSTKRPAAISGHPELPVADQNTSAGHLELPVADQNTVGGVAPAADVDTSFPTRAALARAIDVVIPVPSKLNAHHPSGT